MTSHLPTPGTLIAGHLGRHPPVPFFTVRVAVAASRHVGARPYVKPGVGASAFLFVRAAVPSAKRDGARPYVKSSRRRGACHERPVHQYRAEVSLKLNPKKLAELHEGPHPIVAGACRPRQGGFVGRFVSLGLHAATLGVERTKDVREVYGEIRND